MRRRRERERGKGGRGRLQGPSPGAWAKICRAVGPVDSGGEKSPARPQSRAPQPLEASSVAVVSQSDPVIQLCECRSLHQRQRKEGEAPPPQGTWSLGRKVQNNHLGRTKFCPFFLQNVSRIHSVLSAPWPPSWFILSPLEKAF